MGKLNYNNLFHVESVPLQISVATSKMSTIVSCAELNVSSQHQASTAASSPAPC